MSNSLAIRHLLIRLQVVNRALRAAVERQAAVAAGLDRPDLVPYCVTDEQVIMMLDHLDAPPRPECVSPALLIMEEDAAEQQLREEAAVAGMTLPLDELASRLGVTAGEQLALILCAAPELDRAYERVIAYILDDLNRRFPCVELLTAVTAGSGLGGLAQRRLLGGTGRLRLLGLLRPYGEAPTDLRQELRVPSGLVDYLLGHGGDLAILAHDRGAVPVPETVTIPPQVDGTHLDRLGKALRRGDLDLVGIWGSPRAGQHEVVYGLAQAAGMPLRQVTDRDIDAALNLAATQRAILWLHTDDLDRTPIVTELLTRSGTPVCLSGTEPWRPAMALAGRAYAEIVVASPSYRDRMARWVNVLPELDADTAGDLAARYRVSDEELRAIATLVRADAKPGPGLGFPRAAGRQNPLGSAVARAVFAITCGPVTGFAHAIIPRRRPEDLVLPPAEDQMVLEFAAACRAWPRIAEGWGFAARGETGGVKALFTGEPGTGKTLAAEVIAGLLGLALLKIDLSQVVSKWVGETEKNLEAAFRQAEDSQAVLFFDEADSLFGKRGEIKHGMDRYANLEVGFLLQRLERSEALVILASNLKESLDKAFTRRFHYIINFPRPEALERERIWRLAFPPDVPVAGTIDFPILASLEMTGASISGAARSAVLLAAASPVMEISMTQIVHGIRRQYQREGRLLRPAELGEYADAW